MRSYNFVPREAKIIGREGLSPDTIGLRLKVRGKAPFHFHPGQFILLSVLGFGEIPVGIASTPSKNEIEVGVRSAGMVTRKICSLDIGDTVGINGLFGNGFPISELKNKDVAIISAGIGLLPLRSLIQHLDEKKNLVKSLTILTGARSPENLLYSNEYKDWARFADVYTTVDDCGAEWDGCVGNITSLFDKAKIKRGSVIIVCGPPVIYNLVANRFAGKTVSESDLYFMLERKMKCGTGKCQHCTCGKLYVCQDGPVFAYADIKYNPEAMQ